MKVKVARGTAPGAVRTLKVVTKSTGSLPKDAVNTIITVVP